jgi:hypothetical protein
VKKSESERNKGFIDGFPSACMVAAPGPLYSLNSPLFREYAFPPNRDYLKILHPVSECELGNENLSNRRTKSEQYARGCLQKLNNT